MPRNISGVGPQRLAVKAEDLDAGGGIDGVRNVRAVLRAGEAVLGRKQRGDVDPGLTHQIHIAAALAIEAGLIGDQADAFAGERLEFLRHQNVEAGPGVAVAATSRWTPGASSVSL